MTETRDTKKYQPSPAKQQASNPKSGHQTDGRNRELSETPLHSPSVDVIKEQKKTDKGYEDLPNKDRAPKEK